MIESVETVLFHRLFCDRGPLQSVSIGGLYGNYYKIFFIDEKDK